jgi:hypothetical protein
MQNGKSRATADRVADVEAAQHTISVSNALRMNSRCDRQSGLRANKRH